MAVHRPIHWPIAAEIPPPASRRWAWLAGRAWLNCGIEQPDQASESRRLPVLD